MSGYLSDGKTPLDSFGGHAAALIDSVDDLDHIETYANGVREGGRVLVTIPVGRGPGPQLSAVREQDVASLLHRYGTILEIAKTNDNNICAAMAPRKRRGAVAVWTGYAIGPWHPSDIVSRGLGGSETAAWRLSEELARMGYQVTLYGHFEGEGLVSLGDEPADVMLKDFQKFDPTEPLMAFIGFRNAAVFELPINAAFKAMWLEDLPGPEGLNPVRAEHIDRICTVSHWHKGAMLEHYPWLKPEQVTACRNGIEHSFFDAEPEREKRVVFTSSPDRGLDILLEIWPEIRKQVPDAELVSTYSRWYDIVAERYPEARPFRTSLEKLGKQPGVSRIKGGLGQRDVAHLMKSSMVWAHPAMFTIGNEKFCETSCISAMEAQAAGCVCVAANWGALSETVQVGTMVDGDPRESEFRDRFVSAIVQGLTDPVTQQAAQVAGPQAVREMDWRGAAEQLSSIFEPARS